MTESDSTVKLTVDGREITGRPGEMIIAAAERSGVLIPRFCYHPRMRPVGVCRMCLVEVKGPRGFSLQPACYLPIAEGMEVLTKSDKAKKAQDGVLEYLLANHPLDCPVCDKGGECPLQDQTMVYGPGESRFVEEKRHFPKPIPISKLVYLDRERCIQCDRCTRFADEVAGEALISFIGRGSSIQVNTFPDLPFSSYFSGNTVQICPVGALTAVPYRFKARPWDLEQVESTCTGCSVGCQMVVQSSENEIVRYLGLDSEAVNHSWLCDKGRFGFEAVNSSDRLGSPMIRRGSTIEETSWSEVMGKLAGTLKKAMLNPLSIAVLGGAHLPNEDIYAWSKLAKSVLGTDSVDAQLGDGLDPKLLTHARRASISDAVAADVLVLITGDVREELPVLFLRLREAAVSKGLKVIELSHSSTSMTSYSTASIRCAPGELERTVISLLQSDLDSGTSRELADARRILSQADPTKVVVLGGRPDLASSSLDAERAIARILDTKSGSKLLSGLRRANINGAIDLGLVPGLLPGRMDLSDPGSALVEAWNTIPTSAGLNAEGILNAAADGQIDVLFLLGADPVSDFKDPELARRALLRVDTVVAIETLPNASTPYAKMIMPASAFSERLGSTTNIESRVSLLGQKLVGFGLSKPEWMIAVEIAAAVDKDLGFESLSDIWTEIVRVLPLYAGMSLRALSSPGAREGILVPLPRSGVVIGSKRVLDPIATPGITSVENQGPPSSSGSGQGSDVFSEVVPSESSGMAQVTERDDLLSMLSSANPSDRQRGPGELVAVLRRRLFDGGTLLSRSKNLTQVCAEPKVSVGSSVATELGIGSGSTVSVSGDGQFWIEMVLEVDEGVGDGLAIVDLDGEAGMVRRVVSGDLPRLKIKVESA